MSMLSEILQRADIQQIRSFLLEGVDCGEIDPRDYETRIRVARGEMTDLLENLIPDPETLDRMV